MKHQQRGHNLIELMIVVAIIAILAAITLPFYGDYIKKAKVTEANVLFGGLKTETIIFYHIVGHWPASLESMPGIRTMGNYVKYISYTGGDNPSVCMTLDGFPEYEDKIGWTWVHHNDNEFWSCKAADNAGCAMFIEEKYLPVHCRAA